MRMRRRAVGRSVVRVAATTAVVAGTAGAVRHHQDQRYANKEAAANEQADAQSQDAATQQQLAYQQGQIDALQQQQAAAAPEAAPAPPPPPAAAAPAPANDMMAQLQQLASMHTAGVLSDEEFAAAKQKLLAG